MGEAYNETISYYSKILDDFTSLEAKQRGLLITNIYISTVFLKTLNIRILNIYIR